MANKRSAASKRRPKTAAKKKAPAKKKAGAKKPAPKKPAKKPAAKRSTKSAAPKAAAKPKLRPVGQRKVQSAAAKRGGDDVPSDPPSSKRNFGLRGAAPWVARHAAKHAEELRKRNAQPPPPGSARATLRTPDDADAIKNKVGQLHQITSNVRNLRKRLDKSFFEIGELLDQVQREELHVAKGYSSFEAFLDREIDLPRSVSLRLIRIIHTFTRDTAYDFGLDRLTSALAALDGEVMQAPPSAASSRGWSQAALPPKPPIRFDD